jgi:hypothetical protein
MDLGTIRLDPARLTGGCYWRIWREPSGAINGEPIRAPGGDCWVLIVPQGMAFERAMDEERRPFLDRLRAGKALTTDESTGIVLRAHGRATLRGWGGLTAAGEAVPFSDAKAIEFMTEEPWTALREFVMRASTQLGAAAHQEEEQAAKN